MRKFVYGPGIDEPICMIDVADGNTIYYYHFDGLGSVVALSDVNSVIVERYSYDVFGEPNCSSDVNNPYLFTGRRYDSETGLYYYRARYYDYYIGRFLQVDPIVYEDSMNLYIYVGNNPQTWVDPFGLYGEETHRSFGEYGYSKFDYARLDRDYSPKSRYIYRHFRSREDVILDLENACQRGDARDFEYHMHELQDTHSHGRGTLGIASHAVQGTLPDDPERNERARQAAEQADRATRFWERMWHRYNPPGSEWPERFGRFQQQLEELEKLLDKTNPLMDWYKQQRGLKRKKGANL